MDRQFTPQRNSAGVARYSSQFYVAPVVNPTATQLTVDGTLSGEPLLGTGSLARSSKFIDKPAPRERCIILGARDNRIIP
jgi:hypothetical protein